VADRSLVLDANILIRAVLGKRVGQLIEQYVGAGVPTWTTDRVELFLANKEKSKPLQTNEESAKD